MTFTAINSLAGWVLLCGGGFAWFLTCTLKSTRHGGTLSLGVILLAGLTLYPPLGSRVAAFPLNEVHRPGNEQSQDARSAELIITAQVRSFRWSTCWQVAIITSLFLVTALSITSPQPRAESILDDKYLTGRLPLLLWSAAGLCGCAAASNLWLACIWGRFSAWMWLLAYRTSPTHEMRNDDPPSSEGQSNDDLWRTVEAPSTWDILRSRKFWISFCAIWRRGTDADFQPSSTPLMLLVMREIWMTFLLLAGLVIAACWTGHAGLSLDDMVTFHPQAGTSTGWGIVAIILLILGAGWNIPLSIETLTLNARADLDWTAWSLIGQLLSAALIVGGCVVRSSLGSIVTAETILLVIAGWWMMMGAVSARRQTHVRRWLSAVTISQGGLWLANLALVVGRQGMTIRHPHGNELFPSGDLALFVEAFADLSAIIGICAAVRYLSSHLRPMNYLDELRGMWRIHPIPALCIGLCLLCFMGGPLTIGFWSRWLMFGGYWNMQLIQPHTQFPMVHGGFLILGMVTVISQAILILACLEPLRLIFLEHPVGRTQPQGGESALSVALLSAFAIVGFGLFPEPLLMELLYVVVP